MKPNESNDKTGLSEYFEEAMTAPSAMSATECRRLVHSLPVKNASISSFFKSNAMKILLLALAASTASITIPSFFTTGSDTTATTTYNDITEQTDPMYNDDETNSPAIALDKDIHDAQQQETPQAAMSNPKTAVRSDPSSESSGVKPPHIVMRSSRHNASSIQPIRLTPSELNEFGVTIEGDRLTYLVRREIDLTDPKNRMAWMMAGKDPNDNILIQKNSVFALGVSGDQANAEDQRKYKVLPQIPIVTTAYNKGKLFAKFWYKEYEDIAQRLDSTRLGSNSSQSARTSGAREKALLLRDSLIAGASFADIARRHSADPSARANGGDLGWTTSAFFDAAFVEEIKRLAIHEISQPIRSSLGLHIVQVTDRQGDSVRFRHVLLQHSAPSEEHASKRKSIVVFADPTADRQVIGNRFLDINRLLPLHIQLYTPGSDTSSVKIDAILWFEPTNVLVQALPERIRSRLKKELDAATFVSTIDQIETAKLERLTGDDHFMDLWRASDGAIRSAVAYPNPARDNFTLSIHLQTRRSVEISINSLFGAPLQTLYRGDLAAGKDIKLPLDVSEIAAGFYLLAITTDQGETAVQRLIIER